MLNVPEPYYDPRPHVRSPLIFLIRFRTSKLDPDKNRPWREGNNKKASQILKKLALRYCI